MALDKERIKESLSLEDIHKILTDLGSEAARNDLKGNLVFTTVCHNRCNGKHKLYYYHEDGLFHCYTECGDTFDIYELIIRSKKQQGLTYTFYQSVQYVASLTGKHFTTSTFEKVNSDIVDDWEWINRHRKQTKVDMELPSYDEKVLDVFLPYPHEEWLDEGISYETHEKFNIGYYIREEKISIPHYDINNRLIGLRGRAMNQEDIDNGKKYMPLMIGNKMYNHQTMLNLYGIHKTSDAIKRLKKVAIFEGEKSVLKCEDLYQENNFSVASCSSNLTNFHRDILLSLGVEEVIICFDRHSENATEKHIEEYQKKLLKLAKKFVPYCRTYILWDDFDLLGSKMSPVDKGKEVLEQLMKTKYEIKTSGVE